MVDSEKPDVDDLPERPPLEGVFKLVTSAYLDNEEDGEKLGVRQNYLDYFGSNTPVRVWYLRAEGISIIRSDGQPFFISDMIKTEVVTKTGIRPARKTAPAGQVAAAFLALDEANPVSASPNKVGQDGSAVGRIFQVEERALDAGGGYEKRVSLFPIELKPADFVYDGEVTTIDVSDSAGAEETTTTPVSVSDEKAESLIVQAFDGKTPGEMYDAILGIGALSGTASALGVNLQDAALDETLVDVLVERGSMSQDKDGVLHATA